MSNNEIKILKLNPKVNTPAIASAMSAGYDLQAAIDYPLVLLPNDVVKVKTGIAMHINNPSLVAMLYPRSGLGTKGIVLANGTGVIDADYQGEIIAVLWNRSSETINIEPLERIVQLVFQVIAKPELVEVSSFGVETTRQFGGFGSTGR